jgi:very-short-patch-repair endonuclease
MSVRDVEPVARGGAVAAGSALIRDEFAVSQGRKGTASVVKRFLSSFVERELCRVLQNSGLRVERRRRYDFKAAHGFRKWFKTQCFGPRTAVFTSEGVKQIRKVRASDLVLTGSGHYRAVKRVFTRPYVGEKMWIDFGSSSSMGYTIHPTPEHPILTPLGYVEARYIKKGDLVAVLAKRCPECGKKMPFFRTFCIRTCATREMHRRFEVLAKFRFYGGKAAMAAGFSIEEKRIEYQRKYLAKRGINANEYWLGLLLDRLAPGRFRYVGDGGVFVGKYCPDFIDEEHKTIIEVFGGWHKRVADGERRTAYFMERGYRTIIVWEEEMRRPIKVASRLSAELGRAIPPYNQADFVFTKVVWSAMKTTKRSLKVYNLEVDVDNSYLANGVVVHNCEQAMKPANVEVLMGHSIGISDSYYRPTEKELPEDYLRAVPLLSITEFRDVSEVEEKLRAEFEARLARLEGEMREYLKGQAASFAERQAQRPTPQAATSGS